VLDGPLIELIVRVDVKIMKRCLILFVLLYCKFCTAPSALSRVSFGSHLFKGGWYHIGTTRRLRASPSSLAVTYSLIYAFLKKQAQTKAADAVKKAARNIIVLKDDLQLEGPQLDEIVKQWKELQAAGIS
jgi:hypothetical protein